MKKEIIELRKQGLTYNEIVEKIGCAKSTVSYHCNKENIGNDLTKLVKEWNISDDEIKMISNLYSDGLINDDIYNRLKINNEKITKHKIKLITKKYRNGVPPNKGIKTKKYNDEFIDNVQNYYNNGHSLRDVCKKYNVARTTIREYLDVRSPIIRTKEEVREQKSKSVIDWRRRTKIKLVDYKGGECVRCGYDKNVKVLQFHHEDPNEKDFTISGNSWSFERLKKEVDKCILVCANCHIEIHDEIIKK